MHAAIGRGRSRCRCSPRRCTSGSRFTRARCSTTPTSSCRRCGGNSAGTSNWRSRRPPAGEGFHGGALRGHGSVHALGQGGRARVAYAGERAHMQDLRQDTGLPERIARSRARRSATPQRRDSRRSLRRVRGRRAAADCRARAAPGLARARQSAAALRPRTRRRDRRESRRCGVADRRARDRESVSADQCPDADPAYALRRHARVLEHALPARAHARFHGPSGRPRGTPHPPADADSASSRCPPNCCRIADRSWSA